MFLYVASEFASQHHHEFRVCFYDYCYAGDFDVDCLGGDFDVDCFGINCLLYLVGWKLTFFTKLAHFFDLLNVKVTQPPPTAYLTSS